ncbi:hypothetical protein BDV38DRAFT_70968 [Aspergillus pseudotamarii]|uniref:HTH La-type RNA-binding domain-containing protein n=1 Tax=Aspergillus pseudotamarii TaxID=132259 RepID=A0A5N6SYC2_ASPPS|nr:uncharacterized protein BDV38DRAFT_70968 [Aspergillus pseudotamarii]KAE8138403.1 hypothetical protein BDV38DRAFT_70968 [Aspergillus pseudotamarii]
MAATFSYAQAAKGVAPAQPSAKTAEPNQASKPEEQAASTTSEAGNTEPVKTEESQEAEKAPANSEKELESTAVESSKANVSGTSSPSVGTSSTSTLPKDDEGSNTPNGTSESTWDKQSQASANDKQSNGTENAKEKSAEKEKSEPPKELKAAPLPAVNIWQQRKEAQEAKAKAITSKPAGPAGKTGTSKTGSAASSVSGDAQQDQPKAGSKKKGGDVEGAKDRRSKGRDDAASLPPVGDAALWPTPQSAQGEEKKKSDKSPVIRPSGKEKWTPVPYVPTAVFTTPLPSAARRGGRAPRAGRDGARNGTHGSAAAADKATAGQVAQGSATKQAAPGERGRNEPNSARANSLPAPSRRANSADAGMGDSRKNQATDRNRGPKGSDNANIPPAGKHGHGGDNFRHHREGKGFSRNHDATHKGGDHNSKNPHLPVDSQANPRSGSSHERRFENGPKSAEFGGFHDRKDKDIPRESRADRGRGSHRGRGGFSGSHNSHYPNNHMSQNGFMHPKSFGFGERRSQQHSSGGHRMSLRSPSLPNSGSMYGVYPFPTDINTMYGYQPVHPGPMTAVPYQQYMEPFSLMSMISMQLEYYFSVDNLCKDLFLRRHMDSQGYVPLAFIAGFKRIKTLTEDFELLRHVSRQLRNVDYVQNEDGIDRLRPREKWDQWILPIDQREPTAQHDGPSKSDETTAAQNHVDSAVNGSAPIVNGTGEAPASKTALSSAAPEFSPSKAVEAQNEAATPAN